MLFGYMIAQIKNYSGIEDLRRFQPSLSTKLYDVDGELIAELFREKRDLISFEELPKNLINAFLAAEDRDFYRHFGINPMAILRAMIKNIIAGRIVQGGSTITQQLAKRIFTTGERTFTRKILEAILSFQIEKRFSKEEILEMYFNQIYLGHGCYGISSAARLFFDKEVKHLDVAESSVLAALPSAPNRFSPFRNPHRAYEKNFNILNRMVESGFLTDERAKRIYKEFWPAFIGSLKTKFPTVTASTKNIDNAPYFTDYIRQILLSRFGKDVIYNEGLDVYTTLNLKRQRIGQRCLESGLKKQNEISSEAYQLYSSAVDRDLFEVYSNLRNVFFLPDVLVKDDIESQFNKIMIDDLVDKIDVISLLVNVNACNHSVEKFRINTTDVASSMKVEGALISIEPSTGYITTMIGGTGFNVNNQYNRAVQARRQIGSAFKPFVYGAGIDSKLINAGTALPDAPIINVHADGETWTPGNYGDKFSGLIRVRKAFARSINIISVRIFDIIGPDKIINFSKKMMKVPELRFDPTPSLALGATEFTPFEVASGYAIYANMGRDVIPFSIRYVTDKEGNELVNIEEEVGNIISEKELDGSIQIIPENVAYTMRSLMREVVKEGTATRPIVINAEFKKECVGKTGTTSNWTDAWFCGYTSDIVTVVWVGYDKPFMSLGKHQAGSVVSAAIWVNYTKELYNGMKDPLPPIRPEGVYSTMICTYSGLIPSDSCLDVISEIMINGGGPVAVCGGNHYKMKSILERYIEKEDVKVNKN